MRAWIRQNQALEFREVLDLSCYAGQLVTRQTQRGDPVRCRGCGAMHVQTAKINTETIQFGPSTLCLRGTAGISFLAMEQLGTTLPFCSFKESDEDGKLLLLVILICSAKITDR